MSWYSDNPDRLLAEQEAIAYLQAGSPWLKCGAWRIDTAGDVCLDFEITTASGTKSATVHYPDIFPYGPPIVVVPEGEFWSSHQWGDELCLERGPDNWTPETLGAEMIASARRLLELEQQQAAGAIVPTRHQMTEGQTVRFTKPRLVVTTEFQSLISQLPEGMTIRGEFHTRLTDQCFVAVPLRLWIGEHEVQLTLATAPLPSASALTIRADIFISPLDRADLLFEGRGELEVLLKKLGYAPVADANNPTMGIVVAHKGSLHLLFNFAGKDKLIEFTPLVEDETARSGMRSTRVGSKLVVIIGAGSLGSKVATSLARSGVKRFLLIDDDVFMPENLERHDLDWSTVGEHKVDALSKRIRLITPDASIIVRRHRLGGQEANNALATLLSSLRDADLIVDATANPDVFNRVAALIGAARKPLIWGEVFGGGRGGLIARARPGLDPSPQTARKLVFAACDDFGKPAPRATRRYETMEEGVPIIAEDSDVSVIAGHLTGFALDILTGTNPSRYPRSAYLIGMAEGWIFEQPFDTRPIDLGGPEPEPETQHISPAATAALEALLGNRDGRDPTAA